MIEKRKIDTAIRCYNIHCLVNHPRKLKEEEEDENLGVFTPFFMIYEREGDERDCERD